MALAPWYISVKRSLITSQEIETACAMGDVAPLSAGKGNSFTYVVFM